MAHYFRTQHDLIKIVTLTRIVITISPDLVSHQLYE